MTTCFFIFLGLERCRMNIENQKSAPVYEALERLRRQRIVPFDVPGHKRGRGNPELVKLLGEQYVGIDVNSMKPLDNGGDRGRFPVSFLIRLYVRPFSKIV